MKIEKMDVIFFSGLTVFVVMALCFVFVFQARLDLIVAECKMSGGVLVSRADGGNICILISKKE